MKEVGPGRSLEMLDAKSLRQKGVEISPTLRKDSLAKESEAMGYELV